MRSGGIWSAAMALILRFWSLSPRSADDNKFTQSTWPAPVSRRGRRARLAKGTLEENLLWHSTCSIEQAGLPGVVLLLLHRFAQQLIRLGCRHPSARGAHDELFAQQIRLDLVAESV